MSKLSDLRDAIEKIDKISYLSDDICYIADNISDKIHENIEDLELKIFALQNELRSELDRCERCKRCEK